MKRRFIAISLLVILVFLISGCETTPPLSQIQNATSIVGKIDSIGSSLAIFKVKAYKEDDMTVPAAYSTADENGYFQIVLEEGSYILKVDHIFNETIMEGEVYKNSKEMLGTVKVENEGIFNAGILLINGRKIVDIPLPGNNSPNYSGVRPSSENFDYYFNHPGYKVIAEVESTKASATGYSQFTVNKEGTVLLFDIPDEAAIIMDFVSRGTTFFYTPTCIYESKGAQYINLKLGAYVFAVTSSTFPYDLNNPWRFWVLEPLL